MPPNNAPRGSQTDMTNERKSDEQDKQKLPSSGEKSGAAEKEAEDKSEAPLDPQDEAFIRKNT